MLGQVLTDFLRRHRVNGKLSRTIGAPLVRRGGGIGCRKGSHLHRVRDHEGRIEAHTKLTNDAISGRLVSTIAVLEVLHEVLTARASDGAKVANQLVARHTNAVVNNRQGLSVAISVDVDLQRNRISASNISRSLLVAELLEGVGSVGHQFTNEHLTVSVDGVSHNVQKLSSFSLKLHSLSSLGAISAESTRVNSSVGLKLVSWCNIKSCSRGCESEAIVAQETSRSNGLQHFSGTGQTGCTS
mmetsp:Transcript_45438/g.79437  ORF Transcript_45438/g.79437 Transcript_45438/m.79437 type:complete len:243 (-) Transcript_45438:57-785(-)